MQATYDILDQKMEESFYKSKIDEGVGKIGNIWVGENVSIDKKARIEGSVVLETAVLLKKDVKYQEEVL